jgi:hypothetical protein
MEKKFNKVYRLAKIHTKNNDGTFEITFIDEREHNYGPYYASEKTFDSEEEAVEWALNSPDWMYSDFTVIPIYSKTY